MSKYACYFPHNKHSNTMIDIPIYVQRWGRILNAECIIDLKKNAKLHNFCTCQSHIADCQSDVADRQIIKSKLYNIYSSI